MEFKEDIFPEHKDKIGGLVQFVNLPYESAVEYAWDQLRVTQKGVNFPIRTDYSVSSGEFIEKISAGQDSFLAVETINPRWPIDFSFQAIPHFGAIAIQFLRG